MLPFFIQIVKFRKNFHYVFRSLISTTKVWHIPKYSGIVSKLICWTAKLPMSWMQLCIFLEDIVILLLSWKEYLNMLVLLSALFAGLLVINILMMHSMRWHSNPSSVDIRSVESCKALKVTVHCWAMLLTTINCNQKLNQVWTQVSFSQINC